MQMKMTWNSLGRATKIPPNNPEKGRLDFSFFSTRTFHPTAPCVASTLFHHPSITAEGVKDPILVICNRATYLTKIIP